MLRTIPEKIAYTDESSSRDTPTFALLYDTTFTFDYLGRTLITTIPAGWTTDFGSVPAGAHWFVSNMGKLDGAYVLHDWLYSKACELDLSRNDADLILRFKLKELGLENYKANAVYWAVKWFGASRYKK